MSLIENKTEADLCFMAFSSIDSLVSRQKLVGREYGDRIKALKKFQHQLLHHAPGDALPGVGGSSLDPDMEKLLLNPMHGL